MSWTLIVKLLLPVLPCESVALQVTVVVAIGNVLPELASQVTARLPSTRSLAVGVAKVATAPAALVASMTWWASSVTSGGVLSVTVTLLLVEAVLPAPSFAFQVMVVTPTG